jgi:type IV pilus assembly protein PilA
MTTPNSKLQLALINRKKGKNLLQKGFTLVELMIVIVIVGVLSAVALPNFLGSKNKAEAQSVIGSMAAQAKLCGANTIIGDPIALDDVAGVTVAGACDGTADGTITNTDAFPDPTKIGGVKCGDAAHAGTAADGDTCTLTVDQTSGSVTGSWS